MNDSSSLLEDINIESLSGNEFQEVISPTAQKGKAILNKFDSINKQIQNLANGFKVTKHVDEKVNATESENFQNEVNQGKYQPTQNDITKFHEITNYRPINIQAYKLKLISDLSSEDIPQGITLAQYKEIKEKIQREYKERNKTELEPLEINGKLAEIQISSNNSCPLVRDNRQLQKIYTIIALKKKIEFLKDAKSKLSIHIEILSKAKSQIEVQVGCTEQAIKFEKQRIQEYYFHNTGLQPKISHRKAQNPQNIPQNSKAPRAHL